MDTLDQYVDRDLTRLTQAERLWLWRRRQKSKLSKRRPTRMSKTYRDGRMMTRAEAAAALGLKESTYAQLEAGDVVLTEDERVRVAVELRVMPAVRLGELCTVARRRSGGGLRAVEAALDVSRPKLQEMERYGDPRLVRYWTDAKGFRFPDAIPT